MNADDEDQDVDGKNMVDEIDNSISNVVDTEIATKSKN